MIDSDIDLEQSLTAAHQYISELQTRVLALEQALLVVSDWPNGLHEYVSAVIKSASKAKDTHKMFKMWTEDELRYYESLFNSEPSPPAPLEESRNDWKWVSVKDALPMELSSVFCARLNPLFNAYEVVEGYYGTKLGWSHDHVHYWMPKPMMPAPPELKRC